MIIIYQKRQFGSYIPEQMKIFNKITHSQCFDFSLHNQIKALFSFGKVKCVHFVVIHIYISVQIPFTQKFKTTSMIQERLLDTKRTLENLATQTGKSMEDILKCLSQGNYEFGMKNNKINDSQQNIQQHTSNRSHIDSKQRFNHSMKEDNQLRNCERSEQNSIGLKSDHIEFIEKSTILIQESILDLNRAITMITEDIVQQMVTKKIYKIRQSFRDQILTILGVKQLAFYVLHESGRIQYQDFSSNFITEIMQSDNKCQLLQKIVTSSEQLLYVDFSDSSDLMRMFEINEVKRNQYFGVVVKKISSQNSENIAYCLMAKVQSSSIQNLKQVLNGKLISKIIEISQINTSQDSICRVSKLYSKMMLDLLQILIINYDVRLKRSLCSLYKIKHQLYYSLSALTKIIISKIDENLGNEQSIYLLRKLTNQFEEMQYKKIQEIRMYQKYIRESTVIMLEFNRVGVLQFMSGNRDNCYLNDLSRIWEEGKPVMDSIFGKNQKFQSYIKKAVRGALKSERPLEIADSVKTKITTNGRRIQKIYIMIQDKQQVSSLTNSMEDITLKNKDENVPNHIHVLQKENPGILKQGWLDLFIKSNTTQNMEQRRQGGNMSKKNSTCISKEDNKLIYKRQLSYIPPPKQEFKISMQDISIDNPNINLLNFTDNQLECFAIKVLDSLDYFQRLPQQRKKLLNFIGQMQDNYEIHENPFHNFKHGVNVMHTAYLLSTMPANFNILTVKDIFVNVFSGLCHDVGHTGFTNAFQIASMSRKAMIYNDKSPLENFHASLTFQLLRKQENNFLCHMERDQFAKFRKAVIENILYTDIKQHFPLLNSFNDLLKSGKILGREDAPILSYMIVHASDFAGSTKQFEICKEWSRRVNMQFSNQYKMEGELGIPQTPFMKDLQNPVVLSKAEGGFLKVIVYPLYQSLNNFYITQGIAHKLKKNVEENIKCWQEMNKIETEKAKALQIQKNTQ